MAVTTHASYEERKHSDSEKLFDIIDNSIPDYFRSFFTGQRDILVKTKLEYAKDLRQFLLFIRSHNPSYKNLELKQIPIMVFEEMTMDDIDEYLSFCSDFNENKEASVNRKLASLRSLYKFLQERNYVKNNPTVLIKSSKLPQNDVVITFDDERKKEFLNFIESETHYDTKEIRNEITGEVSFTRVPWTTRQEKAHKKIMYRDYAIFMTLFGTGLRVSELTGIDIDDIDFEHGLIYVHRKGGKNSEVYFGDEVSAALLSYLELERQSEEKALFVSLKGQRITDRAVEMRMDVYCKSIFGKNHPYTPHKCRATYATNLYKEFGDIRVIKDALNHSSLETSKHYVDATDYNKKRAATMKIL